MLDPINSNPYGPDLASALHAAGVDVQLFVPIGFSNADRASCKTVETAPRGGRGDYLRKCIDEARYLWNIGATTALWKPDVIHVQWIRFPTEVTLLTAVQGRMPIVVTAHNVLHHELDRRAISTQRRLLAMAERVIVHEESARAALGQGGVPLDRIDVIPHGVKLSSVKPPGEKVKCRTRLGIPQDEVVFLAFGGVRRYKGFDLLLDAFDVATREGMNARLILAGWGRRDAIHDLQGAINALKESSRGRVHTNLQIDHPLPAHLASQLFTAADCVVLPYRRISHSGVLAQALAEGRAIIASRAGGFEDLVVDGQTGRLVNVEDVGGLAAALSELSRDRNLMERMGSEGFSRARAYAWPAVAERTLTTYEACLTR